MILVPIGPNRPTHAPSRVKSFIVIIRDNTQDLGEDIHKCSRILLWCGYTSKSEFFSRN